MECPICHQAMAVNHVDESTNPKTGVHYERTYYTCTDDDVWANVELPKEQPPAVTIIYTNWRGETAERHIVPLRFWFGHTEWHKEDQWLLTAFDTDKNSQRDFALKDIDKWHS